MRRKHEHGPEEDQANREALIHAGRDDVHEQRERDQEAEAVVERPPALAAEDEDDDEDPPGRHGPFRMIAVATDFGPSSLRARELAVELAQHFEARLVLVHAVEPFIPPYPLGLVPDPGSLDAAAKKELDQEAERARDILPGGVDAALIHGDPVAQIGELVEERRIDLLVVGTHGRRGASRLLLGSVAEKLARTSRVPVLTVHAAA